MFTVTDMAGEHAATILHGFIERIDEDREIFKSGCEMRLTYDNSATLSYHGTLIVAGGNEIETFRVTKPGTFLILIGVSMDGTYFPKITVAGDFREAEKFLMAFQMAGGAGI